MKAIMFVAVISITGCRNNEAPPRNPPAGECCLSYGEMSADGSCMGHGRKCCFADEDRAPLCSERGQ